MRAVSGAAATGATAEASEGRLFERFYKRLLSPEHSRLRFSLRFEAIYPGAHLCTGLETGNTKPT